MVSSSYVGLQGSTARESSTVGSSTVSILGSRVASAGRRLAQRIHVGVMSRRLAAVKRPAVVSRAVPLE